MDDMNRQNKYNFTAIENYISNITVNCQKKMADLMTRHIYY